METPVMGKVLVTALVENGKDVGLVHEGSLPREQTRRVEVQDALVDTGATGLAMPGRLIQMLGLGQPFRTRNIRTSAGSTTTRMFGPVWLTIQGRECSTDVSELPDDCPVLIGQIPLESLDFVVDPTTQRLIGNPVHGGEHVMEAY
jgi:predicted aspartyl protease